MASLDWFVDETVFLAYANYFHWAVMQLDSTDKKIIPQKNINKNINKRQWRYGRHAHWSKVIRFAKWIWNEIQCESESGFCNRIRPQYGENCKCYCTFSPLLLHCRWYHCYYYLLTYLLTIITHVEGGRWGGLSPAFVHDMSVSLPA